MEKDKKKEAINAFLETFASKGLADTTSRDLARSLKLQSGGLYYYFESKDTAVVACAEEAVARLEDKIIVPAINDITDPDKMIRNAQKSADEMAPIMKFLAQFCSSPKYAAQSKRIMDNLFDRYKFYASKAASRLGCEFDEIAPHIYMGVMIISHYMLFGAQEYIYTQIDVLKNQINKLKANSETLLRF